MTPHSITIENESKYSVLEQSQKLLETAILNNPVIARLLPTRATELAKFINFEGSDKPAMPINWRFAESIGILKATEAIVMNALLIEKYGIEPQEITINIDHAQLFIASCLLTTIKTKDQSVVKTEGFTTDSIFPSCDVFRNSANAYRCCARNMYRMQDDRFYHVHSNLNPNKLQDALGLPHDVEHSDDYEKVYYIYQDKIKEYRSAELDDLSNETLRVSGTIVYSVDEYLASEHARLNADKQLWAVQEIKNAAQKPCWWPTSKETSVSRPLAGLKVVDFSRILAAPTLTRGLAEYGASVMRITSAHLPDMGFMHADMGWGKWNTSLDLRNTRDQEKARKPILEADVVVYGYRPEVLSKYGLGCDDVIELCNARARGLIVARLDCYGWKGPWAHRTGWQQISDACCSCGVSLEFGRAMHGSDEPVTPIFPNSDHCAGLAGHIGVISALLMRAERGGSFIVDCLMNSYSHWLVESVGVYPSKVWHDVWSLYGQPKFRHYHPMQYLWPKGVQMLREKVPHLFDPNFFEDRDCKVMNCEINCVKPVLKFLSGKVNLKFQVGTRTNGIDQPVWPSDLCNEVIV